MLTRICSLAVCLLALVMPVKADILIGVVGPFTGPHADLGAQLSKGAVQAANDINAAGGIGGEKIAIEFGDDSSDPKYAVSVANRFIADGVKFVVGNVDSFVGITASDEYDKNDVLEISSISTISSFTKPGNWNAFRVAQNPTKLAVRAGSYLATEYSNQTVVILHDQAKWSTDGAASIQKSAVSSGMKSDLVTLSDKISSVPGPTTIVFYVGTIDPNEIIRNLNISSWTGKLLTIGPPSIGPSVDRNLIAKVKSSGFDADASFLQTYASVQLLAAGIKNAGNGDPKSVATVLKNGGPFQTAIGDISFDREGDVLPQPEATIMSYGVDQAGIREVCGSSTCPSECKGGCPNSSKCCGVASYGWK